MAVYSLSGQVLRGFDCGRSTGTLPTLGQCQACMLVSSVLTCVMVMGSVSQDTAGSLSSLSYCCCQQLDDTLPVHCLNIIF